MNFASCAINKWSARATEFLAKARPALAYLGFGQRRCAHCLTPFFPGDLESPEQLASVRICPACMGSLGPYQGFRCHFCGLPAGFGMKFVPINPRQPHWHVCAACARERPNWNRLAYYGLYSGPLRDMLLRFKFDGELPLGRILGEFLLQASSCLPKPDLLIPIPQHEAHLAKRGYNQALELARELSRLSGLPMNTKILGRVKRGRPQEHLTAAQRKANLKGAFKAHARMDGMHIWLVDDVMTTGSTSLSACEALFAAGCREISVLFVARTSL